MWALGQKGAKNVNGGQKDKASRPYCYVLLVLARLPFSLKKQKPLLHRLSRPRQRLRVSFDSRSLWFQWNSALMSVDFPHFFFNILAE